MSALPAPPPAPRLWTAWTHYGATGEGETLLAMIAYAESEKEIAAKFSAVFDPFFRCTCQAGVIRNPVTETLFPEETLAYVESLEGVANVSMHSRLHFNFS